MTRQHRAQGGVRVDVRRCAELTALGWRYVGETGEERIIWMRPPPAVEEAMRRAG